LLLPLHGGLLVVLPLADLGQDAGLLGRLLEALQRALDRLAFLHSDSRHARGHLPPSGLDSGPLHGRCRRRMQGARVVFHAARDEPSAAARSVSTVTSGGALKRTGSAAPRPRLTQRRAPSTSKSRARNGRPTRAARNGVTRRR